MAKIYEFLAEGFEEIEAFAPLIPLRRSGVEVVLVSVTGEKVVHSVHGLNIISDVLFEEVGDFSDADMLMLPGGLPGAENLNAHKGLREVLSKHAAAGKRIGAICAAPMVLGSLGILEGKKATCYPGFEGFLKGAEVTGEPVTEDGMIITANGPGAALPYAFRILSYFVGEAEVKEMQDAMMYTRFVEWVAAK